jgi:POT family proton-dependent oligopeptide transporter
MFFGMLQFWLSQNIFGDIGLKNKESKSKAEALDTDKEILFSYTISSNFLFYFSFVMVTELLPASKYQEFVKCFSFPGPNGNSSYCFCTGCIYYLGFSFYNTKKSLKEN